MRFVVGKMSFGSREYYEKLIMLHIIAPYDCSPRLREKHDIVIAKEYNHQYYSHEERARAWKEGLIEEKECRPLGPNEKVVNPWAVFRSND